MKLGATFSGDRKYRYRLSRIWNDNVRPLMWLLLNPSTADESRDDPTIRRCIGYAMNWGYGGVIIHNLFAYRSIYPEELISVWCQDPVGSDNDRAIDADARVYQIVCGWGNKVVTLKLDARLDQMRRLLRGADLYHLKLTAMQQPQHPLYLHSRLTMQPFAFPPAATDAATTGGGASLSLKS